MSRHDKYSSQLNEPGISCILHPNINAHSVRRYSKRTREGANKRGNSSRLTQSFHFFMFEPIFSPVNALNQPI
ncbi:hypothetical protein CJ307_30020 [Klebsiella quasipneumoniae]|nr:hypothetical protein CJ307_30020 [Klebsiella quasipneumoniae]